MRTHRRKNGVPINETTAATIRALEEAAITHPELKERTIQEGDLFAHVCGSEKNGYVRCVGLGPTPSDLEMPGTKKCASIELQMVREACRQADRRVAYLEDYVGGLQDQIDELKQLVVSHSTQNNNTPRHGSNTPQQSPREEHDHVDGEHEDHVEEAESFPRRELQCDDDGDDDMHINRCVVLSNEQHDGGGREVILYNIIGPTNVPVAKATIQTTNPRVEVAGTRLGPGCYEVVVNSVFKRDAVLPRPYGDVQTMGLARERSIAWPLDKMKDCNERRSSQRSGPSGT